MQEVMAAITTAPWNIADCGSGISDRGLGIEEWQIGFREAEATLLDRRKEGPAERRLHVGQGNAVLRALGTGQAGSTWPS